MRENNTIAMLNLVEEVLDQPYFSSPKPDVKPPISALFSASTSQSPSRVLAVTGPNAGGKSLFRRVLAQLCRLEGIECMDPSMELRVQSGFGRLMVFGSESDESTGANSAASVLAGIRTCRGRTKRHVIIFDEPDIGLSEGYAAGMGRTLQRFGRELPEHTVGMVIITHSRPLLRELGTDPHYIHIGDEHGPNSLRKYLELVETPMEIETLKDRSRDTYRAVQKILEERKAKKQGGGK